MIGCVMVALKPPSKSDISCALVQSDRVVWHAIVMLFLTGLKIRPRW